MVHKISLNNHLIKGNYEFSKIKHFKKEHVKDINILRNFLFVNLVMWYLECVSVCARVSNIMY